MAAFLFAPYLSHELGEGDRDTFAFNLDDLLLCKEAEAPRRGGLHFILICGFCNSTLLARYLELVPNCLVLKEPPLLSQLAMLRYSAPSVGPGGAPRGVSPVEWQGLASLSLRLLSRTFERGQTVVVKAADVCSCLGDLLLRDERKVRLVLLTVPLRTFVLSVLKSPERRAWVRARVRFWRAALGDLPFFSRIDPSALSEGEAGAYCWLATEAFFARIRNLGGPGRVLALDGGDVAESPAGTIGKLVEFLGLGEGTPGPDLAQASDVGSRHSKRPGIPYDAQARRDDLVVAEELHGREADSALEWAAEQRLAASPAANGTEHPRARAFTGIRCPGSAGRLAQATCAELLSGRVILGQFARFTGRTLRLSTCQFPTPFSMCRVWAAVQVRCGGRHPAVIQADDFFSETPTMARQFDLWQAAAARGTVNGGLGYVYARGAYRFLAASAGDVFEQDLLLRFLGELRVWTVRTLHVGHASTPQIQLYRSDCWRNMVRDHVGAEWHYLLPLAGKALGRLKILRSGVATSCLRLAVRSYGVTAAGLEINRLLVHRTREPYGMEEPPGPVAGGVTDAVLLDGYLW